MLDKDEKSDEIEFTTSTKAFKKAIADAPEARFVLSLYVSGMTPRSRKAIDNIRKLCDEYLKDRYDLEIVDIYQQPSLAKEGEIIAAPTLVKKLPLPLRKIIGDMGEPGRIMVALGIAPDKSSER